jgi:hypothetical protein
VENDPVLVFVVIPTWAQLFNKSKLVEGECVLAIKVKEGDKVRELAGLVLKYVGHGCVHFGMFVDTTLN